ncbi:hypothetical protein HY798_04940 [Candidatus Falkowbacteria bacterium]|nr:hypothetical protein [Candidatus Falkowbacteria bacterium]
MDRKGFTIIELFIVVTIIVFSFGCKGNTIVGKLVKGEALTQNEKDDYNKQKDSYDKLVAERKQEIAETTYKEATKAEKVAGKRMYMGRSGKMKEFDISFKACQPFGFLASERVEGPKGKANVVGVYEDHLWFHTDGIKGAGFSDAKNKDEFAKKGFKPMPESTSSQQQAIRQSFGSQTEITQGSSVEYSDVYFPPISKIPYMKKGER